VAVKEVEVMAEALSEAALEVRALAVMVVVVSADKEVVVMVVAVKLVVGLKEVLFRPLCKLNIL
jgi:hypothetical protein